MTATASFVASASVTGIAFSWPTNITLPAVDTGNTDLTVQNSGGGPVYLSFAPSVPVGPTVPTNIVVPAGATVLLTNNPATLAAMPNNALVVNAGAQPGAATVVSAVSPGNSASLTFTRGTATAHAVWSA